RDRAHNHRQGDEGAGTTTRHATLPNRARFPTAGYRNLSPGLFARSSRWWLLGDAEALEAEGLDRVAPHEQVPLSFVEAGLVADQLGRLAGVREGAVGVRVVDLEGDLLHADDVAVRQPHFVVEDAEVDPARDVAAGWMRQRGAEGVRGALLPQ